MPVPASAPLTYIALWSILGKGFQTRDGRLTTDLRVEPGNGYLISRSVAAIAIDPILRPFAKVGLRLIRTRLGSETESDRIYLTAGLARQLVKKTRGTALPRSHNAQHSPSTGLITAARVAGHFSS